MAETVALKIEVDSGKSIQTLGKIEKELSDVNKEMNELSEINNEFKQELIELEAQFKKIPKTSLQARKVVGDQLQSLKTAIKDNNLALQNFRLKKKQLNDLKRDIKAISNEFIESTETVLGFGASLGEAAAGIMLLSGASEENKEKLEKAIGVALAFEGVANSISGAIKIWNQQLKDNAIVQGVLTAVQSAYNFVVQGTTLVTKALRLALLSLPFVAIGVAIAGLIAYWDDFVGAVKGALKWLGLYDDSEEQAQARAKARLQEERKLRKERIQQIENDAKIEQSIHENRITNLDNEIKLLEAQGKSTTELQRKKLQEEIAFTKAQNILTLQRIELKRQEIEQELKTLKKVRFFREESLKKNKDALQELKTESQNSTQAIANAENELAVFEANLITEKRNKNKEANKEKEDNRKKEEQATFDLLIAKKEADAEEIEDARKKAEALINIENLKLQKELENKELTDAEKELIEFEHLQNLLKLSQEAIDEELLQEQAQSDARAEQKLKDIENNRMLRQLEAEMIADEIEQEKVLKEEQATIDFENKLLKLEEEGLLTNELEIALENQLQNQLTQISEEAEQKRLKIKMDSINAGLNLSQNALGALSALNRAFAGESEAQKRKAFEREKKLNIAMALISGAQAQMTILAQTPKFDFGVSTAIQMALAAVTTIAQIATIKKTTYTGGGGGTSPAPNFGGGGVGVGASAPQIDPITNTSTLVPQEQEPTQVFVTETDITNTQNQVAVIETQATIK